LKHCFSVFDKSVALLYKEGVHRFSREETVARIIKRIFNAVPAEEVIEVRYARGIGPLVIRK
jgi:hypothetical protein